MINKIRTKIQGKSYLNRDSLNNCGTINSFIRLDIMGDIPEINDVYLASGKIIGIDDGVDRHMFVYIPPESYGGKDSIIIDGAIDQFTKENKQKGLVNSNRGSESEFKNGSKNSLIVSKLSNLDYYVVDNTRVQNIM